MGFVCLLTLAGKTTIANHYLRSLAFQLSISFSWPNPLSLVYEKEAIRFSIVQHINENCFVDSSKMISIAEENYDWEVQRLECSLSDKYLLSLE